MTAHLQTSPRPSTGYRWSKRAFDFLASLTGLICLGPLMVAVAVAIRLLDGSPVFYRQERMGIDGEPFVLLKYRSMRPQADQQGPKITVSGDQRVTRVGHWLRKTKLDELPQLWNVVRGEMTIVGPRPEVRDYVDQYTPEQREVLALLPGITDPASLKYFDENELLSQQAEPLKFYLEEVMPDKIDINLRYAQDATFLSDLKVILDTVSRIFTTSS